MGVLSHRPGMAPDLETIADTLPRRYRAVLDAIDRLERGDAPDEARRWRELAIGRYSRRWDMATLRWFEVTLIRITTFERARAQAAVVNSGGRDEVAA